MKHDAPQKRRWKRFLTGAVGGLLLMTLIYPLWFPLLLKPVAARLGVQFENYRRHGYARIELLNVHWTDASVSISAERLDLQMPHHWLWTRLTGSTHTDPQGVVRSWRAKILSPEEPSESGIGSTAELLDVLQSTVASLGQWVHSVVLTNGEVQLAADRYAIPLATLREGQVRVDAVGSRAIIDITSLPSSFLSLSVSNELAGVELEMRQEGVEWAFDGSAFWQSNHFVLEGRFDRSDWLPATATLGSDALEVPSALHGLGEVPDLHGSLQAMWTNASYRFAVTLTNLPTARLAGQVDPVSLQAGGSGDLGGLELDRLDLAAPFLTATLDKPLTIDFSGSVEGRNTTLNLWVDLSQVEAIAAEGQLSGVLTVKPTISSPLRVNFSLQGTNIAGAGLQTKSVAVAGSLDWPHLQMTGLTAEFGSGGRLIADCELEIGQVKTNASGWRMLKSHWEFNGPLPVVLPEAVKLETLHARGTAEGIWPNLTHTGRVDVVGLEAGAFRAATGRVGWAGRRLALDRVAARLANGSSTIEVSGKGGVEPGATGTRVEFDGDAFKLVSGQGVWELNKPFQFSLVSQTNGLVINLSPLELTGPGSRVIMDASLQWPSNGSGRITIQGLRSSQIGDFLAPDLPELIVPEAALSFAWENGPLVFDLDGQAQWRDGSNSVWSATGHAQADGQSLQFDSLRVDLNAAPCAELTGFLPLGIEPAKGWSIVESSSNSVAQFDVRVVEEGPLWSLIEEQAGMKIASPKVEFRVRGELPEVKGELIVHAAQVRLMSTNTGSAFVVPDLNNIWLEAGLDLDGIELRRADAQLLGQEVSAQAHWAIAAENWTDWWDALRSPDWQLIAGNLRASNAELSALSVMAPGIIAPIGNLDLDLSLQPGLHVNGHLRITNGATRFLKPLGALRDIQTDITLEGWNARLNTFTATLGGRPVTLSGELAWRADGDRQFDLRLTGDNLSLVRDPELFVRADLNLHLQKSFDEVARLSGEVQLQRSLLFRDFNSLISFDRAQPEQRPPYFSIPQPPFGDWRLDVRVKGDRFLNVFSPAFKGEVSAGLQLLGTLREPIAIGAVTVDSGKILFPFGTLQIESGRAALTREDPYRPRLDFRGEGQNYGYTVTVVLSGPMDAPNLTFQSVPPLSAQQILMMLTAGEIPRSDFGYDATDKAGQVGYYVGKEFVNRFIGNTSTTERLTLKSGENITDGGRPTYSIEYRLTDRWSAFGEYNRFQNINSGLKFKVLSK